VFLLWIDAGEPVGQPFERLEHRVEKSPAIGVEDLAEVEAERFGDRRQNSDV